MSHHCKTKKHCVQTADKALIKPITCGSVFRNVNRALSTVIRARIVYWEKRLDCGLDDLGLIPNKEKFFPSF
jgi:hypothetical protein